MTITDYYVTTDAMGSVTAILDDEGNLLERRSYDAFGEMTYMAPDGTPVAESPTGVDVGFQAQIRDEVSGLYQMGYRWYNPALGRWLSRDPIGLSGGYNSALFARNNSGKYTDPNGLWGSDAHEYILELMLNRLFGDHEDLKLTCKCCGHLNIYDEMIKSSKEVDSLGGQGSRMAPMHGMTDPEIGKEKSIEKYNTYNRNNINNIGSFIDKYRAVNCPCNNKDFCAELRKALRAAGQVYHAISDRHSPAHKDFKEWPGAKGAVKGGLIAGGLTYVLGASTGVIGIAVLIGAHAGSGANGHGDHGNEGIDDYDNLEKLYRDELETDLDNHLGDILTSIYDLCR